MISERPSQIPVAVSKRSSLSLPLQTSTNGSTSRPTSPLTFTKPPFMQNTPYVGTGLAARRHSLLGSGTKKTTFGDVDVLDDATVLKAQIAILQTSLFASHQRILELSQSSGLNTSLSSSPGGMRSSLPGTPVNGLLGLLPDFEGLTPGSDSQNASALIEEDELASTSVEFDSVHGTRTIPHSSSSYDLRSRAITPGKNGTPPADKGISRHLERVKQEVRSCQRVIGSLTRQTEDQKDTRERMRVEREGLNNVIIRKDRLLQEVRERARAAESSVSTHESTRKALELSTKKSLAQMSAQLSESQNNQARAEREAENLREGVRSLKEVWAREMMAVREEWKRGEERGRREREEARETHLALVKLVQSQSAERATIQSLADIHAVQSAAARAVFEEQIAELRGQVERGVRDIQESRTIAGDLAGELARLRRLMREPRRADLEEAMTL
ncbi:MAG: hypothetical protein TREMPRED_004849 [Tremellales sp. Tagirdzhanova-0007]|nr:MAG: hypothetical protein TREMPRED_004849 [Tremellales sp. Tagirdzhanova-0007]